MDFIDINNAKGTYSNEQVFITIKYILKNEKDPIEKRLIISHFIRYITNESLLENTIELLEKMPVLENTFANFSNIDDFIKRLSAEESEEKIKIKATVFSISLYYQFLLEKFKSFIQKSDLPELKFKIVDRKIEFNLSEITEVIKRKSIGFVRDEIISIPNIKNQEIEIKKMIQSMEIIDYNNDTNSFGNEIKHLESIKNNLIPVFKSKSNIRHENIFSNNGFELFEYILNEYIKPKGESGRYEELSYYYRCLFEDNYIHQKVETFKEWFSDFYEDEFSKIKTKENTTTTQRKKDYSSALEWFKHQ